MSTGIIGGADGPTAIIVASTVSVEAILFIVVLSLLLLHELDAAGSKEWKMLIGLKNMAQEKANKLFVLIHLPLYFAALCTLTLGGTMASYVLKIVIDVFLLGHAALHFGFRKHPGNAFVSRFSKIIIYSMAALALLHLCLLFAR